MGSFRPKKSLGQHFLRDGNIARNIVAAIGARPEDVILEIGPGEGALTGLLAQTGSALVLVELDARAAGVLRRLYGGEKIEILQEDVLSTDLAAIAERHGTALRIVGNIPYYITSPILFRILDHRSMIRDALLMMQKDVARRLVAVPRTKEYGILSVFCTLFTDAELLFDVPPGVFYPKPRVMSSVIRLSILRQSRYPLADEAHFRRMVRAIFGKRRKTLRNSLGYFLDGAVPALPQDVDMGKRPEELSVEELVGLSNALFSLGVGEPRERAHLHS